MEKYWPEQQPCMTLSKILLVYALCQSYFQKCQMLRNTLSDDYNNILFVTKKVDVDLGTATIKNKLVWFRYQ